jgi:transcription initiation protein SPT3
MEKIVVQQLRGIMNEVMTVAYKRNASIPTQSDFEFLIRNPAKVQRFRKYMKSVYKLKVEQKQGYGINFLNKLAEENATSDDEQQEFYDHERTRRLFRADRISQILNPQKYEEFQKARTWSSNVRNKADMLRKLVEILQIPKEIQDNSPETLEIIIFIAQETIASVVDYAILTRLNSDNHCTDPFAVASGITNNLLHLCPEVTQGRGQDGVKAITVQEINEAIRRVQSMSSRRMGTSFRSCEMKIPFLAL